MLLQAPPSPIMTRIEPKEFYLPIGTHPAIDEYSRIKVEKDGKIHSLGVPNPLPDAFYAAMYLEKLEQAIIYIHEHLEKEKKAHAKQGR